MLRDIGFVFKQLLSMSRAGSRLVVCFLYGLELGELIQQVLGGRDLGHRLSIFWLLRCPGVLLGSGRVCRGLVPLDLLVDKVYEQKHQQDHY